MTLNKAINAAKHYFVDTTGSLLTSVPIYAAIETFVAGMSAEVSLESRIKIAAARYCGLGIVYAKGRDISRKIFKVTKDDSETKKIIHDSIYTSAYNIPVAIAAYLSSGASTDQIIKGTICAVALGLASGPITGYNVDIFRHLMGTKESERTPTFVRNLGTYTKRTIAAGLILTTILSTAGIYSLKNYTESKFQSQSGQP